MVNGVNKTLQRYFMLTNHDHLFDVAKDAEEEKWDTGLFLEIPEIKQENYISPSIMFHLNKTTFMQRVTNKNDIDNELKVLANKFAYCITSKFREIISSADDKENSIVVKFKDNIQSDEEIQMFINVLEYMTTLYALAS